MSWFWFFLAFCIYVFFFKIGYNLGKQTYHCDTLILVDRESVLTSIIKCYRNIFSLSQNCSDPTCMNFRNIIVNLAMKSIIHCPEYRYIIDSL